MCVGRGGWRHTKKTRRPIIDRPRGRPPRSLSLSLSPPLTHQLLAPQVERVPRAALGLVERVVAQQVGVVIGVAVKGGEVGARALRVAVCGGKGVGEQWQRGRCVWGESGRERVEGVCGGGTGARGYAALRPYAPAAARTARTARKAWHAQHTAHTSHTARTSPPRASRRPTRPCSRRQSADQSGRAGRRRLCLLHSRPSWCRG